jgi:hypothetical protein
LYTTKKEEHQQEGGMTTITSSSNSCKDSDTVARLSNPEKTHDDFVNDHCKMDPIAGIDDYFEENTPCKRLIHVLVTVPEGMLSSSALSSPSTLLIEMNEKLTRALEAKTE